MLRRARHHLRSYASAAWFCLRLPALSPTLASASVTAWHATPGQALKEGDALLDVTTTSLQEENSAPLTLTLELHEQATLVRVLTPVGTTLRVGQPLALLCEEPVARLEGSEVPAVLAAAREPLWQAHLAGRTP